MSTKRLDEIEQHYQEQRSRYQRWVETEERLRDLVPKALETLSEALEDRTDQKQRVSVALAVLRMAGLADLQRPKEPNRDSALLDFVNK